MGETPEPARDMTAEMLTVDFLKQATPFSGVDDRLLRQLASCVERRHVPEGETIIRQGEAGEECYLLRSGSVTVTRREEGGTERHLATLGAGSLFGEAALLTEAPRNATVCALGSCELLVLRRSDLLMVMGRDRQAVARIMELLRLRARPRRLPGVIVQHQAAADGDTLTLLKDPRRGACYRLSAEGWFIWQRLDGEHTLRDLTLDYYTTCKAFAPFVIARIIEGLAAAGFLATETLRPDVAVTLPLARLQRWCIAVGRVLQWRLFLCSVDPPITAIYRYAARFIYTLPAQLLLGVVAVAGVVVFPWGSLGAIWPDGTPDAASLVGLIAACLLAMVVHEAAHAFTVKAFGREVPRIGMGWYWFGPILFVDTSDMWLAGRWPRIAVSLAGPYANLVLAGCAALVGRLAPGLPIAGPLWQLAFISYLLALINLNPLLEYDGYYVLCDLLDRPNLRRKEERQGGVS